MPEKLKEDCLIVCYGWFSNPLLELDKKHQKTLSNGNIVAIAKSYSSGYGNYICLKTPNGNIINLIKIDDVEDVDYEVKKFDVNNNEVNVIYKDDYGFHSVTCSLSEIPEEKIQESVIERAVYDFGESVNWGKRKAHVWAGGISSMPFGYEIDYDKKCITIRFSVRSGLWSFDVNKYESIISFADNKLALLNQEDCKLLNGCINSLDEINQIIDTINKSNYWKDIRE